MRTAKGERADVRPSRAPQWYTDACVARASLMEIGSNISNEQWREWSLETLRREVPDATEEELGEVFASTTAGPRMWLVGLVRDFSSRTLARHRKSGAGMSLTEHQYRSECAARATFPDITDEEIRLALSE